MLNKAKALMAKALEYNVAEAAFAYYMEDGTDVELEDLATDIVISSLGFKEGYILMKLRENEDNPGEALGLPDGIAAAIKRCYVELPQPEAEGTIQNALNILRGHALLHLLS